jgi:hypothetical protein
MPQKYLHKADRHFEEAPALPIAGLNQWMAKTDSGLRAGYAPVAPVSPAFDMNSYGMPAFEMPVQEMREPVYITAYSRYPEEFRDGLLNCDTLAPCRDAMTAGGCAHELPTGVKIFCEPWQYSMILTALAPVAHYFRPYHVICTGRFLGNVTAAVQGLRRALKVNVKWQAVCAVVVMNQQDSFLERLTMAMMESHHEASVPLAKKLELALAEDYNDAPGCHVQITNPNLENLLRGNGKSKELVGPKSPQSAKEDSKSWSSAASTSASSNC